MKLLSIVLLITGIMCVVISVLLDRTDGTEQKATLPRRDVAAEEMAKAHYGVSELPTLDNPETWISFEVNLESEEQRRRTK